MPLNREYVAMKVSPPGKLRVEVLGDGDFPGISVAMELGIPCSTAVVEGERARGYSPARGKAQNLHAWHHLMNLRKKAVNLEEMDIRTSEIFVGFCVGIRVRVNVPLRQRYTYNGFKGIDVR